MIGFTSCFISIVSYVPLLISILAHTTFGLYETPAVSPARPATSDPISTTGSSTLSYDLFILLFNILCQYLCLSKRTCLFHLWSLLGPRTSVFPAISRPPAGHTAHSPAGCPIWRRCGTGPTRHLPPRPSRSQRRPNANEGRASTFPRQSTLIHTRRPHNYPPKPPPLRHLHLSKPMPPKPSHPSRLAHRFPRQLVTDLSKARCLIRCIASFEHTPTPLILLAIGDDAGHGLEYTYIMQDRVPTLNFHHDSYTYYNTDIHTERTGEHFRDGASTALSHGRAESVYKIASTVWSIG